MCFKNCHFYVLAIALLITFIPKLTFDDYSPETHSFFAKLSKPSGAFAQTGAFKTHYTIEGPKNAPLVIVMHGISISSYSMTVLTKKMNELGLQTLTFDFAGRGHSESPLVDYTSEFYVEQVYNLLNALKLNKPLDIVALSMGGAVTVAFAEKYPELVKSVSFLAPAGVPFEMPLTGHFLRIPFVGKLLLQTPLGVMLQARRIPKAFAQPTKFARDILDLTEEAFYHWQKEGFAHAFSSTVTNFRHLRNATASYAALGTNRDRCVTFFWGEEDQTVPFPSIDYLHRVVPHADVHLFKQAGHGLLYERVDIIAENIVRCTKLPSRGQFFQHP